jgi:hypothetical protein
MRRARKKIGMPMPVHMGRMPTREEDDARCAFPECGYPVSIVCDEVPLCNDHKGRQKEFDFDGIWHKFLPGCKLDSAPLLDRRPEGKTLIEVFAEEEKKEEAQEDNGFDVDDFMKRLSGGEFDPED